MELIFEIVFQFVFEVLLQIVVEALVEVGFHGLRATFKKPINPWFASIGYCILGVVAGGVSLWLFPTLFIRSHTMQMLNVAVSPIFIGLVMALLGAWRKGRGSEIVRLDRFTFAYLFALTMALTRFILGA